MTTDTGRFLLNDPCIYIFTLTMVHEHHMGRKRTDRGVSHLKKVWNRDDAYYN